MSQVGQFLQYAEGRDPPRRRVSSPWKFSPPPKASEYHLIDLSTGVSHGGFETLTGARRCAREKGLRPGISSTAMFGSSTTIRGEINTAAGRDGVSPRPARHLQPKGRWWARQMTRQYCPAAANSVNAVRRFHSRSDELVVLEQAAYVWVTILRGRTEEEWLVAPWWPCRGEAIRTIAPDKLPRELVEECARFADDEFSRGSASAKQRAP
jgi:hypothetical protein